MLAFLLVLFCPDIHARALSNWRLSEVQFMCWIVLECNCFECHDLFVMGRRRLDRLDLDWSNAEALSF